MSPPWEEKSEGGPQPNPPLRQRGSLEVRILHAPLGVIFQADQQMAPRRVAEIAMAATAFPTAVTEFQQHFAVGLRFENKFLRCADPIRRGAAGALPAHE